MNCVRMNKIVDRYENYFNLMYGRQITAIKDLVEKETEWVDMHRGTTLMIFDLKRMRKGIKVEIHSIRPLLIETLLGEGYLGVIGEKTEFWIREEKKIHGFFKILDRIDYFA